MKTRTRFLIGSVLLVAAVAYLMYSGVQQSSVYYLTIEEFIARKEALADEGIRVAGRVALGSVSRKMTPQGEEINFRIGDFTSEAVAPETVAVHFVGVTPDMFKSEGGSDVIVEGKYRDGKIHAQSVLTSCPSKYEAESGTTS